MEKAGDCQPGCWQNLRDHRQTEQQRISVRLCDAQTFTTFIKQQYMAKVETKNITYYKDNHASITL